jgi:hypothetical protein
MKFIPPRSEKLSKLLDGTNVDWLAYLEEIYIPLKSSNPSRRYFYEIATFIEKLYPMQAIAQLEQAFTRPADEEYPDYMIHELIGAIGENHMQAKEIGARSAKLCWEQGKIEHCGLLTVRYLSMDNDHESVCFCLCLISCLEFIWD